MYVMFGNGIIDSKEVKETIEEKTEFKIIKDMCKGVKRDDILAYNLSINIDKLNERLESEYDVKTLSEDELFEKYLDLSELLGRQIITHLPKFSIMNIKAYKWEPSDNDIKLVVVIAHKGIGEVKVKDIMKRLLRNQGE